MGFVELSPHQIAHDLFGHLKPGEKVAITGRFVTSGRISEVVTALESRGLIVRQIAGEDPMSDFCFLKSAKKKLVGKL